MKKIDGQWTSPKVASFSGNFDAGNPFFSPDGKRIYFYTNDTTFHNNDVSSANICYVNKTDFGWSKAFCLSPIINSKERDAQPTIAENGNLYYLSFYENAQPQYGLYYSKFENGEYQEKILMDSIFNTTYPDWTPFIAPDESYFIFCSFRPGGIGTGDLYISFKQKEGNWGPIKNMGNKINTPRNERFPILSPDGKYLFFNSTQLIPNADEHSPGNGNGDVYWVSSKIIDYLKTENLDIVKTLISVAENKGVGYINEEFIELRAKHNEFFNFNNAILYQVAEYFIQINKISIATEIFKINAEIFPDNKPASQQLLIALFDEDLNSFNDYCRNLIEQVNSQNSLLEDEFNNLGYQLIGFGEKEKALKVFELNTKLFPASANVYDSYAEALMGIGNKIEAIANYQKSLALNPENNNAKQQLIILEK